MKGIYLLVIEVKKDIKVSVGSLGILTFNKGYYVYVGSAQNSLEKRIARHLLTKKGSNAKKLFWHIDYLLEDDNVEIVKVFYKTGKKSEECEIARELSKTEFFISKFGSSDCKCVSHLFKIKDLNKLDVIWINSFVLYENLIKLAKQKIF